MSTRTRTSTRMSVLPWPWLLSSLRLLTRATAQQQTSAPTPVTDFQWAVLDNKALYIQGGSTSFNSTFLSTNATSLTEFHSLDLTQPWTDDRPSWTTLPPGPATAHQALLICPENKTATVWDSNTGVTRYDLVSGSWSPRAAVLYSVNAAPGIQPVMQPGTDTMLAVSGYLDNGLNGMLGYNFRTQLVTPIAMGSGTLGPIPSHFYYASVWSTVRKSLLVYGGVFGLEQGPVLQYFHEYYPDNNAWADLEPSKEENGTVASATWPGPRYGHCMVPAYNGTKIVLFGGYTSLMKNVSTGMIHLLDVATMTWTQGTRADPLLDRGSMACTCVGDSFVAWGGDNKGQIMSNTPIIYNLRTGQWVHQFNPIPGGGPTFVQGSGASPSSAGSSGGSSGTTTNHAGIIGGAVAAVVAVLAMVGLIFQRRRRRLGPPLSQTRTKDDQQLEIDPDVFDTTEQHEDEKQSYTPSLPSGAEPLALSMSLPVPSEMETVTAADRKYPSFSPKRGIQGQPEVWQQIDNEIERQDPDLGEEVDEDKDNDKNEEEEEDISLMRHQNPFSNSPQHIEPTITASISSRTDEIEPLGHTLERESLRGSFRSPQWPSDGKRPSSVTFPDPDPSISDPQAMMAPNGTAEEYEGGSDVRRIAENGVGAAAVVMDRRDTRRNPQWRAAGDYPISVTFRPPTPPIHSPQAHQRDLGMERQSVEEEEERQTARSGSEGEEDGQEPSLLASRQQELLMERSRLERELQQVQERLWRHHIPASAVDEDGA